MSPTERTLAALRLAYADPPYPGMARRYGCEEVDYRALVCDTLVQFDGWALSMNSRDIRAVLPLCPDGVRVAAWCKTWCSFKKHVNPAYSWEPLLFRQARRTPGMHVRDWLTCPADQINFFGSKPPQFCRWMFRILGAHPTDSFTDLYPGTGSVGKSWDEFVRQPELYAVGGG